MTLKKQIESKTKNSVETCEKKVLKPFKPSFFSENFIYDPLDFFAKTIVAISIRMAW